MDLNQIRSFLAVTQTLNFTGAARQNGVPQSTISRQISDLEEQLGVKLFYRTKRDVQLTQEGRTFLPYAREMLDAMKKGAYAVKQLQAGAKGRLSIATVATSAGFVAGCLRQFALRYPDIVVDITYVSSGDALLDEGEDPYDFHFLHRDMLPDSDQFGVLVTHVDSLGLIVANGHPLTQTPLEVSALQQEKFLLVSEEESPILYMQVMDFCRAHRFSPNVINRSNDVKSVLLGVSAGLGVSILPSSLAAEAPAGTVEVVVLGDTDAAITYAMAWKKSLLNPAARLFLPVVQELAEQTEA